MSAVIATYLGLFFDYNDFLAPGEDGIIMLISADRAQSQTLLRYIKGILHSNAVFSQYIQEELKESIQLIVISSPYARYGTLYEHFKDYYGQDDSKDILVWKSHTRLMNPTISQDLIDREMKKDASTAESEWMATFREDLEQCVRNAGNLAPISHLNYHAFCDPSGGRADAFTLGIGHMENDKAVVDLISAWNAPFNPSAVVSEIADILRPYRCNSITGDRYAGEWVASTFRRYNIAYNPCPLVKSELYLSFGARVSIGQVELPENDILVKQLLALERRRNRSGRDSVDHPPRGHDDLANSAAGCAYVCFENENLIFPELRRIAQHG
jgi:hypothetical protein